MTSQERFRTFYADAGEAAGPGAHPMDSWCPPCPPPRRHGSTPIDAVVGLTVRLGLAAALWSWARANALPVTDWSQLSNWFQPEPGLAAAASVWFSGLADPQAAAFQLVLWGTLLPVLMAAGVLTRLTGLAVLLGALVFVLAIAPQGWSFGFIAGALGLYLALRGAGPLSVDWAAARLTRIA
ncbi:MAG: hypothetical protein ACQRW7_12635 [Caulobacterales bacterium]|uniref:hypothetical protein n=1 Tax=Glycocaulis sp. TaxID=1969725 RepID=UPI003F9EC5CD